MTLEDRLKNPNNPDGIINTIASHNFSAALTLWGAGEITRQNVINFFSLDATEQTQLDEIKSKYDGLNNINKAAFHGTVEAANIAYEIGAITSTKWKSILGITT